MYGVFQMFVKRNARGTIKFILAKISDEFLLAIREDDLRQFLDDVKSRFEVSKVLIDTPINFNGCHITVDEKGSIEMCMRSYMESVRRIDISRIRRKQADDRANSEEHDGYHSLDGSIIWAGSGALPPAAYAGHTCSRTPYAFEFIILPKRITSSKS